jgi:hypothetical protein
MGIQAVELYRQIPKEFLDEVTYICILNACSHSGLVDEAPQVKAGTSDPVGRVSIPM